MCHSFNVLDFLGTVNNKMCFSATEERECGGKKQGRMSSGMIEASFRFTYSVGEHADSNCIEMSAVVSHNRCVIAINEVSFPVLSIWQD